MCHAIGSLDKSLAQVVELPERVVGQQIKVQLHLPIHIHQCHFLAVPHYLEGICK